MAQKQLLAGLDAKPIPNPLRSVSLCQKNTVGYLSYRSIMIYHDLSLVLGFNGLATPTPQICQ